MSIRGCGRLSFFVAMMGSLSLVGAECGGGDDNAAGTGNASSDLAGTWCLIKTLVTATEDHPAGKQFPPELVFVVHGNRATMSTPGVSGSAEERRPSLTFTTKSRSLLATTSSVK